MSPIISALKHHKITVILVALEIALACAIITNAVFVIGHDLRQMHHPTGIDDDHLVVVTTNAMDIGTEQHAPAFSDLAALRAVPGVRDVAQVNTLPLFSHYWGVHVYRQAGDKSSVLDNAIMYVGTPGVTGALGLTLVAGRPFRRSEFTDYDIFKGTPPPSVVIVSRMFARQMWPGQNPLGHNLYLDEDGKNPVKVVGVADHLLNPVLSETYGTERSFLLPVTRVNGGPYVLRVADPAQRGPVAEHARKVLLDVDPARIVKTRIYDDVVHDYFHDNRAAIWLLLAVVLCLLAVSALGIVGLSSFWVQQRTRQIGIRRAIGARQVDILRYFQMENLLIVGVGAVLGAIGAVLLNLWLMKHYELPRLSLGYVPIGMLALCVLGQLSVLGPARKAARVPPVVATRSV